MLAILTPLAEPGAESTPLSDYRALDEQKTLDELRAYLHNLTVEFSAPHDADSWQGKADELRQRILEEVVFRGVPDSWRNHETQIVWAERIPGDGYTIRKLRYEIIPGLWAGALLYEPENLKGKVPAILNVNGHERPKGMMAEYKQQRCINQAKRGILALNLEWIGMGQLNTPGLDHNNAAYLDLCGRSGLSVFYLALKHGLDVLCEHEAADPQRIGVTGLSGGGWQTIFISSLDTRVKLAVPNAGYIGIQYRIEFTQDIGDLEQCPTDLHSIADYTSLTAMLHPRPALLIYNAEDDCCFPAERARESVFEPILPMYENSGQPDRFAIHINTDPGTHNYLLDNQLALYRFIDRHFRPRRSGIQEDLSRPEEILDEDSLSIDYPAAQADFLNTAAELMKELPRVRRPAGEEAAKGWRRATREALENCVKPDATMPVRTTRIEPPALPDSLRDVTVRAWRVHLGETWTVPMVTFAPSTGEPRGDTLIVADLRQPETVERIREVLDREERALVTNILFTGECVSNEGRPNQYPMLIATLGHRPLGVQVAQLRSIIARHQDRHPGRPFRIVASGRLASFAVLVTAALQPGLASDLALYGLESSLKEFIEKQVNYNKAAPVFCFGFLDIADIPDLADLATPARVTIVNPPQ